MADLDPPPAGRTLSNQFWAGFAAALVLAFAGYLVTLYDPASEGRIDTKIDACMRHGEDASAYGVIRNEFGRAVRAGITLGFVTTEGTIVEASTEDAVLVLAGETAEWDVHARDVTATDCRILRIETV